MRDSRAWLRCPECAANFLVPFAGRYTRRGEVAQRYQGGAGQVKVGGLVSRLVASSPMVHE